MNSLLWQRKTFLFIFYVKIATPRKKFGTRFNLSTAERGWGWEGGAHYGIDHECFPVGIFQKFLQLLFLRNPEVSVSLTSNRSPLANEYTPNPDFLLFSKFPLKHLPSGQLYTPYPCLLSSTNWPLYLCKKATTRKLTLHAPTPQNGRTHSTNSSANCRQIVWVCLTILWGWRLKG